MDLIRIVGCAIGIFSIILVLYFMLYHYPLPFYVEDGKQNPRRFMTGAGKPDGRRRSERIRPEFDQERVPVAERLHKAQRERILGKEPPPDKRLDEVRKGRVHLEDWEGRQRGQGDYLNDGQISELDRFSKAQRWEQVTDADGLQKTQIPDKNILPEARRPDRDRLRTKAQKTDKLHLLETQKADRDRLREIQISEAKDRQFMRIPDSEYWKKQNMEKIHGMTNFDTPQQHEKQDSRERVQQHGEQKEEFTKSWETEKLIQRQREIIKKHEDKLKSLLAAKLARLQSEPSNYAISREENLSKKVVDNLRMQAADTGIQYAGQKEELTKSWETEKLIERERDSLKKQEDILKNLLAARLTRLQSEPSNYGILRNENISKDVMDKLRMHATDTDSQRAEQQGELTKSRENEKLIDMERETIQKQEDKLKSLLAARLARLQSERHRPPNLEYDKELPIEEKPGIPRIVPDEYFHGQEHMLGR